MIDLEEEMEAWPFRMGGGGGGGPAGVREEEDDETEEEEGGGGGFPTRLRESETAELFPRYGGGGGGASRPPLRAPEEGTWGAVQTTHTQIQMSRMVCTQFELMVETAVAKDFN